MQSLADKLETQRQAIQRAREALGLPAHATPTPARIENCFVRWYDEKGLRRSSNDCTVDIFAAMALVYRPNDPSGTPLRRRLGSDGFIIERR